MKKLFFTVILAMFCAGVAGAQEKGFTAGTWFQASPVSINGQKQMSETNFQVSVGYAFNRVLFLRTNLELMSGYFDVTPIKTYERTGVLGLTVGANVVSSSAFGVLEVALTGGNTIVKTDWNFASYDIAARWYFSSAARWKYGLGLGIRYFQSHNSAHRDYCTLYCSIGCRFN